ncbi:MAG: ABC transporter substrate-binding protein, partial [Dehalococcoidia bacterium]
DAEDSHLLGTGPFRLTALGDDRVLLEKDPDYWKGEPARVDSIEFRTYPSAAAIAAGLRAGDIDLARDLLPKDLEAMMRDPRFRRGLVEAPQKITYFALFNTLTGPHVQDEGVRRALAGVVRTRDLVWQTLGRFGQPASGLIPPGILGHDPGRTHGTA